jgi:hypothetical protein
VFLKPRWYNALPAHIKPPREKLERLEQLRSQFQMRDDNFMVAIASSPWAVIRAQEAMIESLRQQFPGADERKLWTAVLLARLEIKMKAPAPWDPPPEELRSMMESIEDIMRGINSWDDLVNTILDMDRQRIAPDSSSPQSLINDILTQD